jgi:hypothetical protein
MPYLFRIATSLFVVVDNSAHTDDDQMMARL